MSEIQFSEADIERLANQVSDELNSLTTEMADSGELKMGLGEPGAPLIPERLRGTIEAQTGEDADSFLEKIKRAAHRDLCMEGGHLNQQWKKFGDLPTKDVVQWTIGALALVGVTGAPILIVTVSVWLLHVSLHIGIEAICEDGPPA
jgi:hypothetical protein